MNGTGRLALMSAALSRLALFFARGKMLRVLIGVLLTASLVPLTGCDRSEKGSARNELEQLNIPYNQRRFLERVRQSDAVAVDLFLAAGMNPNLKWGEAMRIAAAHGHTDIVKILVAAGGDVNARIWFLGETALCRAASQGHISVVEELLNAGATIEGCGCEDDILVQPANWGQIELVRLLLDHGADPNMQDSCSGTALQNAAESGHAELVRLLLERGADPNVERRYGTTALISAIAAPEILRDLLQSGADVNGRDRDGETALIRAALGWTESLRLLLEYGADVNAASHNGTTALMQAAESGNTDIVRILLRNGADVDAMDKYGGTALLNAMERGHVDVVRLLENPDAIRKETSTPQSTNVPRITQKIRHKKTSTRVPGENVRRPARKPYDFAVALMGRKELVRLGVPFDKKSFVDYARQGDSAMTKLFLTAGISPDAGDHNVGTALMAAAENGDMEMVRLLVESGADPNRKYMPWDTMPLMYAVDKGDMEMVRLLLDHGADVNAKDFHGYTALMRAADKGHIEIARLLLDQKPDVNAKMDGRWGDGSTALYHAVIRDHTEVVRMLLDSGADVNAYPSTLVYAGNVEILKLLLAANDEVNVRGMGPTLLLNAARIGRAEMVKFLLDHGADLNSRDEEGRTDLMIAVRYGDTDAIRLLLDAGAEINAIDHYGQTALMYAAWQGDTAMVKTLLDSNADPALKDMYGLSARSRARFHGHLEMEKLLEAAMGKSSTDEANVKAKMLVFLPVYEVRVYADLDVDPDGKLEEITVRMSFHDVNRQTVHCRDIEIPVTIRIAAYTTDKKGHWISHEGVVYRRGYVITGAADVIRIPGEAVKIEKIRAQAKKVDASLGALVAVPYHKTILGWSGRKLVWNLLE